MAFKLFVLWTFILIGRPQDIFAFLIPMRPALTVAVIVVAAIILKPGKKDLSAVFETAESRRYLLFYLVMILGIPFAYHRHEAFNYIFLVYLMNILFFVIFLLMVDSIQKIKSVIFAVSLSVFCYSVFSLLEGRLSDGRLFIYGKMFDPNDIAYVLVSISPLCLFYLIGKNSFIKKTLAAASVLLSIIVILLSGSRSGVIALAVTSMLVVFSGFEGIKRSHKIAFLACVAVIMLLYNVNINTERYMTLVNIGSDYNVTDEFGRMQIWERALDLFLSNPITGVGVNCFAMALGYLRDSLNLSPKWQATHNSYIQVGVETGAIGLALFISIVVSCFKNFSALSRTDPTTVENQELKTIAGLLRIGFIGHLISAFFLTQGYSMYFTMFFAFSAALRKVHPQSGAPRIKRPFHWPKT